MSELRTRVITALILAPIGIAIVVFLRTPALALVMAAVCAFGLGEWGRLIGLRDQTLRLALVFVNAGIMAALWQWRQHDTLLYAVYVGAVFWPLALLWLRNFEFASRPDPWCAMVKAIAGSFAVIPAWAGAVLLHGSPRHGPYWLLFAVMLVWSADVFAYFAGRRWGKRKLAPRISPGKSIEGVYGALAGTAVFALVGGLLLGVRGTTLVLLIVLALVAVLFSIVGDLFESLMKRHSQVKDSGSLLPGHGGVFDRMDSMFAALPVFALGTLLLLSR
jgi:phosphatidate cytidylyltransferase